MTLVGSSVAVSHTLIGAPLLTAQAIRYAAAALVLLTLARSARAPTVAPRGREWLWLAGIAGTTLTAGALMAGPASAAPPPTVTTLTLSAPRIGAPRVWWRLDSPQMLWSGWPLSSTVPPPGGTTV